MGVEGLAQGLLPLYLIQLTFTPPAVSGLSDRLVSVSVRVGPMATCQNRCSAAQAGGAKDSSSRATPSCLDAIHRQRVVQGIKSFASWRPLAPVPAFVNVNCLPGCRGAAIQRDTLALGT